MDLNKINEDLIRKNKLNEFDDITQEEINYLLNEVQDLSDNDLDGARILILDLLEKDLPVSERIKFFNIIKEKTNIDINLLKKMYSEEEKNLKKVKSSPDIENPDADIMFLILKKKRSEATEKIVNKILSLKKIYTTRDDIKSEVWIYHDGIFIPNGKTYIKEFVREILKSFYTTQFVNEVISKIEVLTYINEEDFFRRENKNELALLNGILDINTKKLYDFTEEKIFFNKLPVMYDPNKKCPNIINFISEILEKKEDIKVVQELFGYCLYKDYQIEKSFMFLGKGRNGKGQLLELLKHFLGFDNCSAVSLQRLCDENSFNISELHTKLVNIGGDIDGGVLENTGMFKQLSGNDLVSAKRKFKNDLKFKNYAKMIFSCNSLPSTKDVSRGFWDRWILLKFPYRFEYPELIAELSDDEKKWVKPRKNNIVDSFRDDDELSGLLNWALSGLNRLIRQSHFTFTSSTRDVQRRWNQEANSFVFFAEKALESDYDRIVSKDDLRSAYNMFCKQLKLEPVGDKEINFYVTRELGGSSDRFRKADVNLDVRVWKRVSFRPGFGEVDDLGFSRFVPFVDFTEKFK